MRRIAGTAIAVVVGSLIAGGCSLLTSTDGLSGGEGAGEGGSSSDGASALDGRADGAGDGGAPGSDGGPIPVAVTGEKTSETIGLTATDVFFGAGETEVRSCILGGCAGGGTVLSSGASKIWAVTAGAGRVFWTNDVPDGATVESCSASGGGGAVLDTGAGQGIVTDGARVLWAMKSGTIEHCPLSGCAGAPAVFLSGMSGLRMLVVAGADLYFGASKTIGRCPLSGCPGGTPTIVYSGTSNVFGVAVDQTSFYWVDDLDDGSVFSCPLAGCPASPKVLATGVKKPHMIATDGASVYFTSKDPTDGAVLKCPVGGCPGGKPTVLAAKQRDPKAIALDATHVYWGVEGGIYKLPK